MKIKIFSIILGFYICTCVLRSNNGQVLEPVKDSPNTYNNKPNPKFSHNPVKVLFIGSSYTLTFDMPGTFRRLTEEAGMNVVVDKFATGGAYLEILAEMDQVKNKINQDKWDYVIFQGGCLNAAYSSSITRFLTGYTYHDILPALIKLDNIVKNNHVYSKSVYMMPWAYKDGMLWASGFTDTYFDMQKRIYNNTLEFLKEMELIITPVGWVWNTVMKEKPEIELFSRDYNHQSKKGTYLAACTIYVTIFKKRLDNVTFYYDLPADEAGYMQETASNIVLNDLRLWNIVSSIETGIRE